MILWAQIINNVAMDVVGGDANGPHVVAGYNPNNTTWVIVPDGTLSGAITSDGGKTFTNPILSASPSPVSDPVAALQRQVISLQAQITALAGAISPAVATAVQTAVTANPA